MEVLFVFVTLSSTAAAVVVVVFFQTIVAVVVLPDRECCCSFGTAADGSLLVAGTALSINPKKMLNIKEEREKKIQLIEAQ